MKMARLPSLLALSLFACSHNPPTEPPAVTSTAIAEANNAESTPVSTAETPSVSAAESDTDLREPSAALPSESREERGCRLLTAAEASEWVYQNFKDFKKSPQLFAPERAFPSILYPREPRKHAAPQGYQLAFIINGGEFRSGNLFVAYYEGPGKIPIVSFKGTSSWGDIWTDLTDKGASYLVDLFQSIDAAVRGTRDNVSSAAFEKFLSVRFLRGPRVMFTGHSLGGALAQNMAAYLAVRRPDLNIELVTYNSLGGSITRRKIARKLKGLMGPESEEDFIKGRPNIRAINLNTADDPMSAANRKKRFISLGRSHAIPTLTPFLADGTFHSRGFRAGHSIFVSAVPDLLWAQNYGPAKSKIEARLGAITPANLARWNRDKRETQNVTGPKNPTYVPTARARTAQAWLETYDRLLEMKETADAGPNLLGTCASYKKK